MKEEYLSHTNSMLAGIWSTQLDGRSPQISGNLFIKKNQVELVVTGNIVFATTSEGRVLDRLFGKLASGTKVTLLKLREINLSHGSVRNSSGSEQTFLVKTLIVYHWWESTPSYQKISFRMPGLGTWLNKQLVQMDPTSASRPKITVDWDKSPVFDVLALDTKIKFFLGHSSNPESMKGKMQEGDGFSFFPQVYVSILPAYNSHLEWYFEILYSIKKLLVFLAGINFKESKINAYLQNDRNEHAVIKTTKFKTYASPRNNFDCFIAYEDIEDRISEIFELWFQKQNALKEVTEIGYGIFPNSTMWLHLQFLSVLHALELFHRNFMGGVYLEESKYSEKIQRLKETIPSEFETSHKDSLKSRIKYGYEYSLNKRMDELFAKLPESLRELIFGERRKFPRKWIDTRNYYTHWDSSGRDEILTDEEMSVATDDLKLFLRVLVLAELGIGNDILEKAINRF